MEKGSECWLADGRKAHYAGEIDGQKFVRLIRSTDDEYGYEEWPDDRLTAVSKVYPSEPEEVYGEKTIAALQWLEALRSDADTVRKELAELKDHKQEIEKAARDYPNISRVLDFIEGRITHVVEISSWCAPRVSTFEDAMANVFEGKREPGLKLLALFGNQKSIHWGINRYSEGSGIWTVVTPARGLDEVRQIISDAADEAIEEWRKESLPLHSVARYGEGEYAVTLPDDVQKAISDKADRSRAARIAKAEKELAEAKAS